MRQEPAGPVRPRGRHGPLLAGRKLRTSAMNASSSVGSGVAVGACLILQLVGRALGDDPAPVDQADAVAILGLVEEVGRDHHRDPALDQGIDVRPELAAGQRVDAGGRLVEKQHVRLVHDRAGQREPLLEPQWQRAGVVVEIRLKAERLDHAAGHRCAGGREADRRFPRRTRGSAARSGRRRARTSGPCNPAAPGPTRPPDRGRTRPRGLSRRSAATGRTSS